MPMLRRMNLPSNVSPTRTLMISPLPENVAMGLLAGPNVPMYLYVNGGGVGGGGGGGGEGGALRRAHLARGRRRVAASGGGKGVDRENGDQNQRERSPGFPVHPVHHNCLFARCAPGGSRNIVFR